MQKFKKGQRIRRVIELTVLADTYPNGFTLTAGEDGNRWSIYSKKNGEIALGGTVEVLPPPPPEQPPVHSVIVGTHISDGCQATAKCWKDGHWTLATAQMPPTRYGWPEVLCRFGSITICLGPNGKPIDTEGWR